MNLKPIVSYTTRPKRINETDGVEYFFIDKNQLDKYKEENKVIEQRVYHTVDGDWYYCTINDKQIDLNKDNYLLSTKDLCSLNNITKILDSNITSIKIEGRMKSPEYVYYVTSLYRKAIDSYIKTGSVDISDKEIENLLCF